ncbi:MAG: methylamine utilization protein MauJ [Segetibacter sp.]
MRTYNVELIIFGPITIGRTIDFNTDKELDLGNVFRSDITIKQHSQGIKVSSTVWTSDQDRAYKVALLFIGKMLDVLSIKTDTPLFVTNNDIRNIADKNSVKAVIDEAEFRHCFELSRSLNLQETTLLRALNWYRKGLYTEDPFDKFLAFWNSINVVAARYHTPNDRTRLGIINQIWNCFETLWGNDLNNWQNINGDDRWINDNNEIRNNIAHGVIPVEVNYVENVITRLDNVQRVAYRFLTQWADTQLQRPLL